MFQKILEYCLKKKIRRNWCWINFSRTFWIYFKKARI